MKKILLFVLVFSLPFAFSYDCQKKPVSPIYKLDHFKVYKVDTLRVAIPFSVELNDQFDITPPKPANIPFIEYFANPVSKNGQRIIDSTAHLTWYRLKDDTPVRPRTVRITNQFGTFIWRLGKAAYLLVPTYKIEMNITFPDTLKLDHFKCYEVLALESLQQKVTLVDQFDQKLNQKEEAIVDRPLFFGVPVIKNGKPIINKLDHLACYHISVLPGPTQPRPIEVSFKNQLGQGTLTIRESYMLCVPSKKEILKEGEE